MFIYHHLRARAPHGILTLLGAASIATFSSPATAQAPLGPATSDSAITLQDTSGFLTLDLTNKDNKTDPTFRIGYQSNDLSSLTKRERGKNPASSIHNLWTYSLDFRATPSGDRGSLFSSGRAAVGSQINVSIGQSYVASYARARDVSVFRTSIPLIADSEDAISKAKAAEQTANDQMDTAEAAKQRQVIADEVVKIVGGTLSVGTTVSGFRRALAGAEARSTTGDRSVKDRLKAAIAYADAVVAYANDPTGTVGIPDAPSGEAPTSNPLYDAWYLRGSYRRRSATFYDPSKAFNDQFPSSTFESGSVQAGYNANYKRLGFVRFPVTLGISGGWGNSDNIDSLPTVEVTDTTVVPSDDGQTQRTLTQKNTGLRGTYKRSSVGLMNVDVLLYPDIADASRDGRKPRSSIALDLFGRFKGGTQAIYGAGLYLTEPGAPTRVYGGLNVYRSERKQLAIDIVAGFPF